jgi:hypothetical protein
MNAFLSQNMILCIDFLLFGQEKSAQLEVSHLSIRRIFTTSTTYSSSYVLVNLQQIAIVRLFLLPIQMPDL